MEILRTNEQTNLDNNNKNVTVIRQKHGKLKKKIIKKKKIKKNIKKIKKIKKNNFRIVKILFCFLMDHY